MLARGACVLARGACEFVLDKVQGEVFTCSEPKLYTFYVFRFNLHKKKLQHDIV